jgi:hypothetical protein
MKTQLLEWEARIVLESLRALNEKWTGVIDGTENEDVKAEYANDISLLEMIQKRLECEASQAFGAQVNSFNRVPA